MNSNSKTAKLFKRAGAMLLALAMAILLSSQIPGLAKDAFAEERNLQGALGSPLAPEDDPQIGAFDAGYINGVKYTRYNQLRDALSRVGSEPVTVDMNCDWLTRALDPVDSRLIIPENANVTLNMHGHAFDRNRTANNNAVDDGELIVVSKNAKLTINGGTPDMEDPYDTLVYNSTDRGAKPVAASFTGGLLTGGASKDGGGAIHMHKQSSVTLNDVTIAGCRAEDRGYGGGIYMESGSCKVELNNSTITGCYASKGGGGIYADNSKDHKITLNNSHVDGNYARNDGAGINIDGKQGVIEGDGTSTISNNKCDSRGGGVYLYNQNGSIYDVILKGNYSGWGGAVYVREYYSRLDGLDIQENSARENGGGFYLDSCVLTVSDCTIEKNHAKAGGGAYFTNCGFTMSNPDQAIRATLQGKTIIRDNTSTNSYTENLYNADEYISVRYFDFDLSAGSDIWIGYLANDDSILVTPPKVSVRECRKYLTSDRPGYYFTMQTDDDHRNHVVRKRGIKPTNAEPTKINPADAFNASERDNSERVPTKAGVVGQVSYAGYSSDFYDRFERGYDDMFDLVRGFYMRESETAAGVFYYSDALFFPAPDGYLTNDKYNPHLGTASWVLATVGGYLSNFKKSRTDNPYDAYYNKHAAARQFLADIGCEDESIYVNDNMLVRPTSDSIGVTIANKKLRYSSAYKSEGERDTGFTLVPVSIRGLGYEAEWMSNVTLGEYDMLRSNGGEAKGFAEAADTVLAEINSYVDNFGLRDDYEQGKLRFWIVGYSRAGATANLAAKRLVEQIEEDQNGSKIYCYTCEAPQGGADKAEKLSDARKYFCIHNMVNKADIVPLVAPVQMGFKRYGVDHYLPGDGEMQFTPQGNLGIERKHVRRGVTSQSVAGEPRGEADVTTYFDNNVYRTKTDAYNYWRLIMADQLAAVDSDFIFDDYFHPKAMDFIPKVKIYDDGDYNNNRVEDFIVDFFRAMQEAFDPDKVIGLNERRNKQAIPSRGDYAYYPLYLDNKDFPTIETAARNVMQVMMSSGINGLTDNVDDVIGYFPIVSVHNFLGKYFGGKTSMLDLYIDVIGDYSNLSESKKLSYLNKFYNAFESSGALNNYSDSDRALFKENFPVILHVLLVFADFDYNYHPGDYSESRGWAKGMDESMTFIPTFVQHSEYILANHTPTVNIAWARTFDDWYANEKTCYVFSEPDEPFKSSNMKAIGTSTTGKEVELSSADGNQNKLVGDQKISLDNEDLVGEAIYYDIYEVEGDSETRLVANQLYRDSFELSMGDATTKSYKLLVYDMSYGKTNSERVYNIELLSRSHEIIEEFVNIDGSETTETSVRNENEGGVIYAYHNEKSELAGKQYFESWQFDLLDAEGNTIRENVNDELDAEADNGAYRVIFKMPEADGDYVPGYKLKASATFKPRTTKLIADASPVKPVAGEELAESMDISFVGLLGNTYPEKKSYPIEWSYSDPKPDDDPGIVPVTREDPSTGEIARAYKDTEYTATIRVPQDEAEGIVFHYLMDIAADEGLTEDVGRVRDTRVDFNVDDENGRVSFRINYTATEDAPDAEERPLLHFKLIVHPIDLNIGKDDPEAQPEIYYVKAGQTGVRIWSPFVVRERLMYWESEDLPEVNDKKGEVIRIDIPEDTSGFTDQILDINACYLPIVDRAEVEIEPPVAGRELPTEVSRVRVHVSNVIEIDPEYVGLSWEPEGDEAGKATYLQDYLAKITMKPKKDEETGEDYIIGYMLVDGDGNPDGDFGAPDYEHPIKMKGEFVYEYGIYLKANEKTPGWKDRVTYKYCDAENKVIYVKFSPSPTTLVKLEPIENISDVPHGATAEDIAALLPATTDMTIKDASDEVVYPVSIEWGTPEQITEPSDPREAVTWKATGTVQLPESVENPATEENPDGLPLEISVNIEVLEADKTKAPSTSLPPGDYLGDQMTSLSSEAGATIYYTIDGSDPSDAGNEGRKEYQGRGIFLDKEHATTDVLDENGAPTGDKILMLKAYAEADGKWDSDVVEFKYVFTNKVLVPKGLKSTYDGGEHTGVLAKEYYTLVAPSSGARIDEDGNAVATNAGTYQVTAKIGGKYRWITGVDEETGKDITSFDDQTIEFTIKPASIANAEVTLSATELVSTGSAQSVKVTKVVLDGIELAEGDYTVEGTTATGPGDYTVKVTGVGNYDDTVTVNWRIKPSGEEDLGEDGTPLGPGASADAAEKAILSITSEKDPAGSKIAPLLLKSTKQTKSSVKVSWKKPRGAVKYVLYGTQCGKQNRMMKIAQLKKISFNVKKVKGKKLKKGTYYKFIVVALDKNNRVVSTSKIVHAATKGGKVGNHKKVTVKKAALKNAKKAKVGKKFKLNAKAVKGKLKVKKHVAMLRYESTNPKVATVSKKGVVKGVAKGKCYVYAYAQNGLVKKVKVTVR